MLNIIALIRIITLLYIYAKLLSILSFTTHSSAPNCILQIWITVSISGWTWLCNIAHLSPMGKIECKLSFLRMSVAFKWTILLSNK